MAGARKNEFMQYLRTSEKREANDAVKTAEWAEKKRVWVPVTQDKVFQDYVPAWISKENGDQVEVTLEDKSTRIVKANEAEKMNPPKFDRVEDIAEISYLNEASVLHNLRQRYFNSMIYTYSGLFLVTINPYKRFPIYNGDAIEFYRNRKRTEAPPHIFAIADSAYRDLLTNKEDQSILVTGESGAGKTENTKKVIQYLASIAGERVQGADAMGRLEHQIIQANPILEAFGNAQTLRNNNSSRFGKFICIHFGNDGKIKGANTESYLLEKSRVTHQHQKERNFHIFYQFLRGKKKDTDKAYKDALLLEGLGLDSFVFTKSSNQNVDGMDDAAEFQITYDAMKIVGFSEQEILDIFRVIAAILFMGNAGSLLKKTSNNDDQAEVTDASVLEKVCHVLGVSQINDFKKRLLKPVIGSEQTEKSQSVEQVRTALEALSRAFYDRMFEKIVAKINQSVDSADGGRNFIGVLDISGFEIFEKNHFEQLCINYTNEKLQQFFNHHMFVLEQEEYRKEAIDWKHQDFGLDLQGTIDLIEKDEATQIGILAQLNDACTNNANDEAFTREVVQKWKGKSDHFLANPKRFEQTAGWIGFTIAHYAGNVTYSSAGWVTKVRDPLNENLTRMIAKSSVPYIATLFSDYSSEETTTVSVSKMRALRRTVAIKHKEQLQKLMQKLYRTTPNFVRCIIPNESKTPGKINARMVLDQLRCNGVLEGIRICRQGFPNRLPFDAFRQRFEILASDAIPRGFVDGKKACALLLSKLGIDPQLFRIGNSKVFFKAGVLAELEERRDKKLGDIFSSFQATLRANVYRRVFGQKSHRANTIRIVQKNLRLYLALREWPWWKIIQQVLPLCDGNRQERENKAREAELVKARSRVDELEVEIKGLREQITKLVAEGKEKDNNIEELKAAVVAYVRDEALHKSNVKDMEEEMKSLQKDLDQAQRKLKDTQDSLGNLEGELQASIKKQNDLQALLIQRKKESDESEVKSDAEKRQLQAKLSELEARIAASGKSASVLESENSQLKAEIKRLEDELHRCKADLESARSRIREIETAHQKTLSELELALATKSDRETELIKRKSEIASLQNDITAKNARIAQLEASVSELAVQKEDADRRIQSLSGRVTGLEKEKQLADEQYKLLEQTRDVAAKGEIAYKKIQSEVSQLTSRLAEREKELQQVSLTGSQRSAAMEENIRKLESEKNNSEKARKAAEAQLAAIKEEFERSKTESARRISRLQADFDAKSEEAVRIEEAGRVAKNEVVALLKKADEEKSSTLNNLNTISQQKVLVEKQLAELRAADEVIIEELKTKQRKELDRKEVELQELRDQLVQESKLRTGIQQRLQGQITSAEEKYASEANDRENRLKQIEKEADDLREKLADAVNSNKGKLDDAKKTISNLVSEVEGQRNEVDEAKRRANEASRRANVLESELSDVKTQLERSVITTKSKIESLEAELKEKTASVKDLKAIRSNLEKELDTLTKSAGLNDSVSRLEKERREMVVQIKDLSADKEDQEQRRIAAETRLKQVQGELDQHRVSSDEEIKKLEMTLKLLKEEARQLGDLAEEEDRKREKFEIECKELRGQVDALKIEVGANTAKGLEKAKQRLEAEKAEMRKKFDQEKEELGKLLYTAQIKANELKTENEGLSKQHENLSVAVKKTESQLKELRDKLEELTRVNAQLSDAKRSQDGQLADMREQLEEARQEATRAIEDAHNRGPNAMEAVRERMRAEWADKVASLESRNQALTVQQNYNAQQLIERQNELDRLNTLKSSLQSQLETLRQEFEGQSLKLDDVRRQLQRSKESEKRSSDEKNDMFIRYQTMQDDLLRARSEYQTQMAELDAKRDIAEKNAAEAKRRLTNLEDEAADAISKKRSLEDSKSKAEKALQEINARLEEETENAERANSELETLRRQLLVLNENYQREVDVKENLERSKKEAEIALKQLQEQVADVKRQQEVAVRNAKQFEARLADANAQVEKESSKWKSKVERLTSDMKNAQIERDRLKQQADEDIENIEKRLQSMKEAWDKAESEKSALMEAKRKAERESQFQKDRADRLENRMRVAAGTAGSSSTPGNEKQ